MKKTRIYIIIIMILLAIILPGCSHKHKYKVLEVIEPTCSDRGYTVYQCKCNDFYKDDFTDALGHIEEIDEARDATCSLPGLTEGSHCSRCGKTIKRQEELPCVEHDLGPFVVDKEPTESEVGQISKHCSMCNGKFEIKAIEYEPSVLTYSLNNDGTGYIVTGYIESEFDKKTFTIPDTHHYMPVVALGERAFANCKVLESIYIPNSILVIGDGAFYGCSSLTSVRIPKAMTTLGNEIFSNCTSLVEIKLTEFLTSMGDRIFESCINLENVIMPDTVSSIGEYAFMDCIKLQKFDIPAALTKISDGMFCGCVNLEDIKLNDSITYIGAEAFFNCEKVSFIHFPKELQTIGDSAFGNCTNLYMISLQDKVKSIGSYAFMGCTNLESIIILVGVTYVGESVFMGCPMTIIVCDEYSQPSTWDTNWNSSNNEVYWRE